MSLTSNQQRAIQVAAPVCSGECDAESLSDADWALLLLASGLSETHAPVRSLACRVVELAKRGEGYFWGGARALTGPPAERN